MFRIEEQVYIERPLPEVFAFLQDITNHPLFSGAFREARFLTEPPFGLGSRVQKVSTFLGQNLLAELEVVGYEQERYIHYRILSGPVAGEELYSFDNRYGGTLFTLQLSSEPKGLLRLSAPLLKGKLQTQVKADLQQLKRLLESEI